MIVVECVSRRVRLVAVSTLLFGSSTQPTSSMHNLHGSGLARVTVCVGHSRGRLSLTLLQDARLASFVQRPAKLPGHCSPSAWRVASRTQMCASQAARPRAPSAMRQPRRESNRRSRVGSKGGGSSGGWACVGFFKALGSSTSSLIALAIRVRRHGEHAFALLRWGAAVARLEAQTRPFGTAFSCVRVQRRLANARRPPSPRASAGMWAPGAGSRRRLEAFEIRLLRQIAGVRREPPRVGLPFTAGAERRLPVCTGPLDCRLVRTGVCAQCRRGTGTSPGIPLPRRVPLWGGGMRGGGARFRPSLRTHHIRSLVATRLASG